MASLWAILGLNATSFKRDLDKARADAKSAGKAMAKDLTVTPGGPAPGGGGGGGSHGGVKSGAMRETLVLMREIGRGNWNRVPGSLSILMQQLGILKFLFNPITIAVAALAGGIYLAYKWTEKLTEQLSDLKFPDIHPEHIARQLQKMSQAAEAQKAINKEVEKAIELYDSAAKSAERLADHTKDEFEHRRKMNQYAMQQEINGATTERQRQAIRAKYAAKELEINKQEREEQRKNKKAESDALLGEANQKQAQGDAIKVSSKEYDEQLLKQKQKAAEEAQKFLDKTLPERAKDQAEDDKFTNGGKKKLWKTDSRLAFEAQRDKNIEEARRRVQDAKDFEDQKVANDETRKKKDELYKQAAQSKSKSATAFKEYGQMGKDNPLKDQREKEESDAHLKAENVKRISAGKPDVNSLQRIGAYTVGRDNLGSSVKSIERNVAKIAEGHGQPGTHNHSHHSSGPHGFGHH